ncbi:MAG: tripartite tricarboxylate transporter permease [Candidatus Diapherotrites archaeon]|nr:tripartite tricarboxylate transporter permease [Candidatus Diapherotrites archaeon]
MKGEARALCIAAAALGLALAQDASVVIGCIAGIVTGLVPGLHPNTFLPFLTGRGFIIGLAVSHSFFSFIPAIMLGAPDEASSLSVLPGHKLLLRGKALEAFRITILGGLFAGTAAVAAVPFLGFAGKMPFLAPIVLVFTLGVMAYTAKSKAKTIAIMAASAAIGHAALAGNALPAMLAGFFGTSTILYSLATAPSIPPQLPHGDATITNRQAGLAAAAGWLAGLFPAVSPSVAAMAVCPRMRPREFLAVLGGTNTVYAIAAVLAIQLIGRPRSGAAIAVAAERPSLLFIAGASLAAIGISAWLAWQLSKTIVLAFNKVNHRVASILALGVVIALTALGGVTALAFLAASTVVGLLCLVWGQKRSTCMASLLIPVLLYFVL